MTNLSRYNKTIVALAGVALSALAYYFSDATWLPFVFQAAAVFGVYQVANKEK